MWTDVLREVVVFLSGGVAGTLVTYVVDNWRHRRAERVKVIADARGLLVERLCQGDGFGLPPKYLFMTEPAFHRIQAFLGPEFKKRLVHDGRNGSWTEASVIMEAFADEISRIEREWKLI